MVGVADGGGVTAVGTGVSLGAGVGRTAVAVCVAPPGVGVLVGVKVRVEVGVRLNVCVGVDVRVRVIVGVRVTVRVRVMVRVRVTVEVGVRVGAGVGEKQVHRPSHVVCAACTQSAAHEPEQQAGSPLHTQASHSASLQPRLRWTAQHGSPPGVRVGDGGAQGHCDAQVVSARSTQKPSQLLPASQQSGSLSQTQFWQAASSHPAFGCSVQQPPSAAGRVRVGVGVRVGVRVGVEVTLAVELGVCNTVGVAGSTVAVAGAGVSVSVGVEVSSSADGVGVSVSVCARAAAAVHRPRASARATPRRSRRHGSARRPDGLGQPGAGLSPQLDETTLLWPQICASGADSAGSLGECMRLADYSKGSVFVPALGRPIERYSRG